MDQEGKICPRVFFLVPADMSSMSAVQKIDKFSVFTKNMHLFFLCRMFLEEIKRGLQQKQKQKQGINVQLTTPNLNGHECSEAIDIKQPRVSVSSDSLLATKYHAESIMFVTQPKHFEIKCAKSNGAGEGIPSSFPLQSLCCILFRAG